MGSLASDASLSFHESLYRLLLTKESYWITFYVTLYGLQTCLANVRISDVFFSLEGSLVMFGGIK